MSWQAVAVCGESRTHGGNGGDGETGRRCSELRTSGRLLDNSVRFLLGLAENETSLLLTMSKNRLAFSENSLRTSRRAHII
jgi:hypothetical protein